MTRTEAKENIAAMRAETPVNAQKRLIKIAIELGRLGDSAVMVYKKRLEELNG
ncbi:MAG: hypothetical protein Unbinned7865contig1001_30 [Prokaryotic dsDNA virus sp.]|nr:MAG: hypothetical protein Unbinned7865contig1001_30 [Prokaryotic dsDNA virus sp.]